MILKASRPPGWCFGPILYGIGVVQSKIFPKTVATLAVAALQSFSLSAPLCIIVFGVNDIYDYGSDVRNPRKISDGLEGTVLPPVYHRTVRKAAYISSIFIIGIAVLTGTLTSISATTLLVILSWQYSATPLRLKEAPVFDSLSNGVIVFLSLFIGFCSSGEVGLMDIPMKAIVVSLCTAGVHALGAVMDFEADTAAGQRTIATFLGRRTTAAFGALAYLVAFATEEFPSIFGVYLLVGLLLMLSVYIRTDLAHRVFQVLVFWTVGMVMLWFGAKAWKGSGSI